MTFYIHNSDESDRVVQSVLIGGLYSPLSNGVVYQQKIKTFYEGLSNSCLIYKIENENGVLAGFFYYEITTQKSEIFLRQPFKQFLPVIQKAVTDFIDYGDWVYENLIDDFVGQTFTFSEYDPKNYSVKVFTVTKADYRERVIRAVLFDRNSTEITRGANGVVLNKQAQKIVDEAATQKVVYKIETQQGVLAGFFYYNDETQTKHIFYRRSFNQYQPEIEKVVADFIDSEDWQFETLFATQIIPNLEYTNYSPTNYNVDFYVFVKLDYKNRTVRAVLLDRGTTFLTVQANGNVLNTELIAFEAEMKKYRILYKIETLRGVLVGFFANDYCIEDSVLAVRRPFLNKVEQIKAQVNDFIIENNWSFDLLKIEPCEPPPPPCYLIINGCYMTINGCKAIYQQKEFKKRNFS